jgi:uncharacterized protein (DUF1800 family)
LAAPLPLSAKKIPVKLPPEAYALTPEARARHALSRLAFGPRPGEAARLAAPGALEAWINGQLYPDKIKETDLEQRLKALPLAGLEQDEIQSDILKPFLEAHREPGDEKKEPDAEKADKEHARWEAAATTDPKLKELADQWQRAKILRAVYGDRQLEAVLTDFWFNHFNVDMQDKLVRFTVQDYEREAIRGHLFDSFGEMLSATAHHPAMLFFLENEHSTRAANARGLSVYQRDPFYDPFEDPFNDWGQLHPVYFRDHSGGLHVTWVRSSAWGYGYGYGHGLYRSLWWDDWLYPRRIVSGNSKTLDAGMTGPVTRYARALLELHTLGAGNFTDKDVSEAARIFTGWSIDPPAGRVGFRFIPPAHDAGDALVLGEEFSGRNGEKEGGELLDLLSERPATARHIAQKFARRFAGDEPPAPLVDKLAAVYTATGGDLRALTVALIEAPEFWQAPDEPARTPFEWTAGLLRAGGAQTDGSGPLQALAELGMPPYRCEDPAGYPRDGAVWRGENSLKMRGDLAARLAAGQWQGTKLSDPGAMNENK